MRRSRRVRCLLQPAFVLLLLLFQYTPTSAQSKTTFSGYVKDLFSVIEVRQGGTLVDNLVHNRLSFEWNPHENWTAASALRTRLFIGDQPENPFFAPLIEIAADDVFDLSWSKRVSDNVFFHTYLDRLYLDFSKDKWQVRAGRQRINWGIHTVWNPNDLFNTFSFTDFDYEERPGSDALLVRYYSGTLSSIEVAAKAFEHIDEAIAAALWKTHTGSYDLQFLAGIRERFFVFGNGWAGNMGQWGFKGEWTAFFPFDDSRESSVSATISWDYIFKNGIFLGISGLYNSLGSSSGSLQEIFIFELSPRNLYPYKWSVYVNSSKQFHPLLTGGMAVVYSPADSHPLFLSPVVTWSALTNFDVDLVGQLAFSRLDGKYRGVVRGYYLRGKWSF